MKKSEEVNKYSIAKKIFEELLELPNLSEKVISELEDDLELCEKKIKDFDKNIALPTEQLSFYAWTKTGKTTITQGDVDELKEQKDLFIDGEACLVYTKGILIKELVSGTQSYKLLECIVENRGHATIENLFRFIYPEKKTTKKEITMSEDLSTPLTRLRIILKNHNLELSTLRGNQYHFENEFLLVRLKSNH